MRALTVAGDTLHWCRGEDPFDRPAHRGAAGPSQAGWGGEAAMFVAVSEGLQRDGPRWRRGEDGDSPQRPAHLALDV